MRSKSIYSKISDTDAELLELTILTHGDCNFR